MGKGMLAVRQGEDYGKRDARMGMAACSRGWAQHCGMTVFSQKIYSEFKSVKCSPANLVGRNVTFHSAREDRGAQVNVSFQHSGKTLL